jgi:hypothetical protein
LTHASSAELVIIFHVSWFLATTVAALCSAFLTTNVLTVTATFMTEILVTLLALPSRCLLAKILALFTTSTHVSLEIVVLHSVIRHFSILPCVLLVAGPTGFSGRFE